MFANLFATRPPRERQTLPWVIAALVQLPVAYLFFSSSLGERVRERTELIIRPMLTVDDHPVQIVAPNPGVLIRPASALSQIQEDQTRLPFGPPDLPKTGLNPGAIPQTRIHRSGSGSLRDRLAAPPANVGLFPVIEVEAPSGPAAIHARLTERLAPFNDSVTVAEEGAKRATDWTVTDKSGNRWGYSPGLLHLGKETVGFGLEILKPLDRREEVNSRVEHWKATEVQAARAEIKSVFDDRVRQIRKRRDAQRAQAY